MLVKVTVGGKDAYMSRERYERTLDAIMFSTPDKKRAEQMLALFMQNAVAVTVDEEFERSILAAEAADDERRVREVEENK
ncbi:MAG: hypothetical protein E7641_03220 [Ruminococcaceae bacterium]|nr:hypothetical protein [Oscillospiraceae bacterium]